MIAATLPLQTFEQRIEHEFIQGSAIAPELFRAAVDFIEDTGYWETHQVLGFEVHTQWQTRKPHDFGILAGLKNEDGSFWQFKPEKPLTDKKGKTQKYQTPKGNGSRAFLPAIPIEIRKKISERYGVEVPLEGSFWEWLEHSEIPRIFTEGGKKALCLLSHGYVAIALYGARGGVLENDIIGGQKVRKLKPELIPDLQRFATPGRKITIALDQDDKPKTRADVSAALSRLGFVLNAAGCQVAIAEWSQTQGKGVDDLIVTCGAGSWEKVLSEAVSFAQWSVSRQLAHEVRRKPDLNISDQEFAEVASEFPKTGLVALWGAKGSGKSKAIGEMIEDQKWLSVDHLTSLGRDQAAGWDGVFVNDGDRHGSKLLKDGVPVNGGSVCVPSLLKVRSIESDVFVIDEVTALLEFLLGSKLCNRDGIRSLLLAEFYRRVREAKLVIIADADLSEEALQYLEAIRGERAYLVKSERRTLTYDTTIIDGSRNEAFDMLQDRAAGILDDKIIYINSDTKGFAEVLAELLGRDMCLLITGDTSGEKTQASLLASKGRDLPGLILQGIRYIISSPSVVQGFSFEHHTDLIDSVWGFYSGDSISAHSIAQAPDRIRDSNVPRFFSIANKGNAYSRLSKAQTVTVWLKEFKHLNTTASRLVAHSLTPEATIAVESLDWQNQNLKMLAAIETRRNRGMAALRETVVALLRKEGKRVIFFKPGLSKAELSIIASSVRAAREAVKNRYNDAVAKAEDITKVQAEMLADQSEPLTPEQVLSLEKFYLSEFYRLEKVLATHVDFDKKGRTRTQIKALEAVLNPQTATDITARTINRNPENPQDWNPVAVKVWILEQSGAAALIRAIAVGEVVKLTSDLIDPISSFIRNHSYEFRVAFGFRNIEKQSDQQIIGEVLIRHGIKAKRCGNKINRRYEIQKTELEEVLKVIERRKTAIAPPLDQGLNQGGVIPPQISPELEKWLTPESLNDVRSMWYQADSEEVRAEIRRFVPLPVLERAIAA